MDAKDHPVISVLGDQRRFVVPIYQRQYSWRDERLSPFWDDVVAKAEEALQGKPKFSHYMGALILAPGGDGFTIGATPRVQVVDGQQRLTTFQLFLAALREVGDRLGESGISEAVRNYLFVRPMSGDTDPDARFKLIPTPEDRAVFHLIMDGGLKAVRGKHPHYFFQNGKVKAAPNAVRALGFFIERIEAYARFGLQDDETADQPNISGDDGPDASGPGLRRSRPAACRPPCPPRRPRALGALRRGGRRGPLSRLARLRGRQAPVGRRWTGQGYGRVSCVRRGVRGAPESSCISSSSVEPTAAGGRLPMRTRAKARRGRTGEGKGSGGSHGASMPGEHGPIAAAGAASRDRQAKGVDARPMAGHDGP